MYSVIVAGTDGSETAERALAAACALAKDYGAALHILNAPADETAALVMSGVGGYVPVTALPDDGQLVAAGEQIVSLAAETARAKGVAKVQTYVRRGDAADQVLALAKEVGADLVVTGRRGLGGVASLFLGSTSQRIAHDSECACLTVP